MLLTYEKYTEFGGKLPENQYNIYEKLAEAGLYAIADGALPDTETVEACMYILVNAYTQADEMETQGVAKSYSNDGVSVSYQRTETSQSLVQSALDKIALLFQNGGVRRYLGVHHRE